MSGEVERLAKRLSPAQRRAVLHLAGGSGWGLCAGKRWDRRTRYALFDRGLAAASRLTRQGLAVRAYLQEQQQ